VPPPYWLQQQALFFQPGDLPDDVQARELTTHVLDWEEKHKIPADVGASLIFEQPGKQFPYGRVDAYFFSDPANLKQTYQLLALQVGGVPEPAIGDQARLSPPPQTGGGTTLLFRRCRTVVQISLADAQQPTILTYAARLAQRLDAVDCQGATSVPILTPPPLLPTWTPVPTAVIISVISPTVQRLPDPDGTNVIRAYTFADREHGWLALGATILATTDGGQSWHAQVQADSPVKVISFISAQVGWIEAQTGYIQTTDSGLSWQRVSARPDDGKRRMPRPPVNTSAPFTRYDFCPDEAPDAGPFTAIDLQTGWAYCIGGEGTHTGFQRLLRTDDGGGHWHLLTDRPPYGWIAANDLYATEDGGTTWRALKVANDFDDRARAIQFLSPAQGFVIVNANKYNNRRDTLLVTDDAGVTWQEIYAAPPPALWPLGFMQFFTNGSGVGAGDNATLLSTVDAGRSWSRAGELDHPCSSGFAPQFRDMSFPDRLHGWAIPACASTPMPVYRTTDGGVTWAALAAPGDADDPYAAVSFVDGQTGYIVTQAGYLLRTDDGGATFAPVDRVPAHTTHLKFVTKEHGWEMRGDQLIETTDGGASWKPVPLDRPVRQFALLPEGRAWVSIRHTACTYRPHPDLSLLATSDGGQTWTDYRLGPIPCNWESPWLDSLQFADALHGWLLGGSALYTTTDGGQSWTQLH